MEVPLLMKWALWGVIPYFCLLSLVFRGPQLSREVVGGPECTIPRVMK